MGTSKLSKEELKQLKTSTDVQQYFSHLFKETIQQILEAELEDHLGYGKYDSKNKITKNSRNGRNVKTVKTDYGEIGLETPRDREGTFEPEIVKKRQTVVEGIEDVVISLYSKGMTTRDISEQIREIYGVQISDSMVSRITNKIQPLITEWQSRPLDTHYLIVWFDAIVFKIRSDGKMTNKACYLAIGLNTEGKKEVLGLWISETESATFWLSVISDIQSRGVEDILIASIDNLKGLDEAIKSIYPKIIIQVCVIHQIRNSLNYVVWKDKKEFARDLKAVYAAPTREAAEKGLDELEQKWADKYPLIIKSWHRNWEKLSSFYDYPPAIRKIMYTTNTIESLNRVIRKFTKARTIFPNDDSVKKVIYLAVVEIGKKWIKPIPNWQIILSQFAIIFPDRVNIKI